MQNNKEIIPPLTGIRAIAAYLVFLMHYNPFVKGSYLWKVSNEAHIGVDIFFVLSGFLITYRYYTAFKLEKKWMWNYFVNRVARIYPMYFILTTSTFIILFLISVNSKTIFTWQEIAKNLSFEFLMNLSFLKGFFNELKFTGIAQGWSLTVEECFYFSAPLVFIYSTKRKLLIYPIVLLIIGVLLVEFTGNAIGYGFFENLRFMLIFTLFGKAFTFYFGIYLALKLINGKHLPKLAIKYTYIGIVCILISVLLVIKAREFITIPYIYLPNIIINFILPVFISLFFYGIIHESTIISKFLSSEIMILLGKSSYIFYLIHLGIIQIFINQYVTKNLLIKFILLNIISIIMFLLIEEPLNRKIRKTFKR